MSSLLPQNYAKSTVIVKHPNSQWTWFLLWIKNWSSNEEWEPYYNIFLVTNYHVIKGAEEITVCMNKTDSSSNCEIIKLSGIPFYSNESLDLVVISINWNYLLDWWYDCIFFTEEDAILTIEEYSDKMEIWREIFMLWFPLDHIVSQWSVQLHPLARQWIIARSDIELLQSGQVYLDINAFPWNSWWPLISKPSVISLEWKLNDPTAKLIGIVKAYIKSSQNYYDEQWNIGMQFSENSGIAIGVPSFVIYNEIKSFFGQQNVIDQLDDQNS